MSVYINNAAPSSIEGTLLILKFKLLDVFSASVVTFGVMMSVVKFALAELMFGTVSLVEIFILLAFIVVPFEVVARMVPVVSVLVVMKEELKLIELKLSISPIGASMSELFNILVLIVGAFASVFMVSNPIVPKVADTLVVDTLEANADAKPLTSAVAAAVALEKVNELSGKIWQIVKLACAVCSCQPGCWRSKYPS